MGKASAVTEAEAAVVADSNGNGPGRKPGTTNVEVTWSLRPASALPPKRTGGFTRNSELDGILGEIKSNAENHGRSFEIGVYADDERSNNSARSKASALRKVHTEAEGWVFRVGPSEFQPGQTALYVQYGG